jgi:hypothetical protein
MRKPLPGVLRLTCLFTLIFGTVSAGSLNFSTLTPSERDAVDQLTTAQMLQEVAHNDDKKYTDLAKLLKMKQKGFRPDGVVKIKVLYADAGTYCMSSRAPGKNGKVFYAVPDKDPSLVSCMKK